MSRAAPYQRAIHTREGWGDPIEAVLFDLDGTLVDTTHLHFEAYRRALAEHGVVLDWGAFRALSGRAARETIPRMAPDLCARLGWRALHQRKSEHLNVLLADAPPPVLGTARLLDLFSAHYPVGLVSAASRRTVTMILDALGWSSRFGAVVAADDVPSTKPDPVAFLEAARMLGVTPAGSVVFEDTDDGVAAARAARMRVFDVRESVPAWRLLQ